MTSRDTKTEKDFIKHIKDEFDRRVPPEARKGVAAVHISTRDAESRLPKDSLDKIEIIFEDFVKELAKISGNEPENIHLIGIKMAFIVGSEVDENAEYLAVAFRDAYRSEAAARLLQGNWGKSP